MKANTNIVSQIPFNTKPDNYIKYSVATIPDVRALKKNNSHSFVNQADITLHVHHNRDATVRVLSGKTFETCVPSGKAFFLSIFYY